MSVAVLCIHVSTVKPHPHCSPRIFPRASDAMHPLISTAWYASGYQFVNSCDGLAK